MLKAVRTVSLACGHISESGFLVPKSVGTCLGVLNPVIQLLGVSLCPLYLYPTTTYEFIVRPDQISNCVVTVHLNSAELKSTDVRAGRERALD
jgi:hypothetical protein